MLKNAVIALLVLAVVGSVTSVVGTAKCRPPR